MTVLALLAAVACLVAALRLAGWRQLGVGVVAALAVVVSGAVPIDGAADAVTELLPVVGYLVAILLIAAFAERGGIFAWLGYAVARAARSSPARLGVLCIGAAAVVTVLLTLDATVVLLAPVLVLAARRLHAPAWPIDLATVRLANSASILLPVSNLTNLIAFDAAGLSFAHFTLLMAPAWLVAVAGEYAAYRATTRAQARTSGPAAPAEPEGAAPRPDRTTLAVLALALVAIVIGGELGLDPVWPALVAAAVLGVRGVSARTDRMAVTTLVRAAQLPFAAFVCCWSIAVAALAAHGGDRVLARTLPDTTGPLALVGIALVAMVAANLVNNLPATLLLVPLAAPLGSVAVLAALIGVGVGAGATYAGSLANLLWLRNPALSHPGDVARRFHVVGLGLTPVLVVLATLALAATSRVLGT